MKYFFLLIFFFIGNIILPRISFSQTFAWKTSDLPVKQYSKSIKAVNQKNIWVCGSQGVFCSTDGGERWNQKLSGSWYETIEAINESTVFVTQELNTATAIMRTTNSGMDWQKVHTESTYINGIKMFDQMTGVAIGDPKDSVWRILRTTDGGLHWDQIQNSIKITKCEEGHTNSIAAFGKTHIWFGTIGCGGFKIYKSTDAGVTWKSYNTPFDDSYGLWFNDSLNGVAAFGSGFFSTSDGGGTWNWNKQMINSTFYVSGFTDGGFWGVADSTVYISTNNGSLWLSIYKTSGTKFNHLSIFKQNSTVYGWFAGSNGKIIYCSGTTTSVGIEDTWINKNFLLHHNYPNPFNLSTVISYQLPMNSFTTLKVYDVLGKEIESLVNKQQATGTYSVEFNGEKLTSGIYFYRLQSGNISEVKKLVLMK